MRKLKLPSSPGWDRHRPLRPPFLSFSLPPTAIERPVHAAGAGDSFDRKYRYHPRTQADVENCWPCPAYSWQQPCAVSDAWLYFTQGNMQERKAFSSTRNLTGRLEKAHPWKRIAAIHNRLDRIGRAGAILTRSILTRLMRKFMRIAMETVIAWVRIARKRRRREEREESDKSYISPFFTKLLLSWRFSAAFLLSLALVRPGCSLFLASFPSFSLFPTPIDRVSSSRCLKARHEADSFEPAEWSERLTSRRAGWLGAAAVGSIPALVTFFSLFSSSSLSLLSFKNLYFSFLYELESPDSNSVWPGP